MNKLILIILAFCFAGSANAAILCESLSGGSPYIPATLEIASTSNSCRNTTVSITSPQVITTAITWPTDRKLVFDKGGYVTFTGAGALTGLNEAKPEYFGVNTTPGTTDMTIAMQSAMNSGALEVNGHGGIYKISSIVTTSTADRIIRDMTWVTTSGVTDRALHIKGDRTTVSGVSFIGGAGINGKAIYIDDEFGGADCKIVGNYFKDFSVGGAISVRNWPRNSGALISGNTIMNCANTADGDQYGSINANGNSCIISNNHITETPQVGIVLFGADYCRVDGNYIEGKIGSAVSGGILTDGACTGNIINGNTIKAVGVEGIQVYGSIGGYGSATQDTVVSNNVIEDAAYSGISIGSADVGGTIRTAISGNTIKSSQADARAIELKRADFVTISGNSINGYDKGINIPATSNNITVTGNTFTNQTTTAVEVYAKKSLYVGNHIYGNGATGTTVGFRFNGSTVGGSQIINSNFISNCLTGVVGTFSGIQRTYIYNNFFTSNGTNMSLTSRGTNSTGYNVSDVSLSGEFTLVAGAATVINNQLEADDRIVLTKKTAGGTAGAVFVNARTNGTSFTVGSTNVLDTSTYYYEFIR